MDKYLPRRKHMHREVPHGQQIDQDFGDHMRQMPFMHLCPESSRNSAGETDALAWQVVSGLDSTNTIIPTTRVEK